MRKWSRVLEKQCTNPIKNALSCRCTWQQPNRREPFIVVITYSIISGTSSFTSHFTTKTMFSSHILSSLHEIISGNYALHVSVVFLYSYLFVCFRSAAPWFALFNAINLSILWSVNWPSEFHVSLTREGRGEWAWEKCLAVAHSPGVCYVAIGIGTSPA